MPFTKFTKFLDEQRSVKMAGKLTNKDVRLEKVYRRLGTREPVCVICGENYAHALERHHIAGVEYHGDEAILCRNCHRKLSDPQIDRQDIDEMDPWLETIGRYLCGLGELLALVAATLIKFGQELLGMENPDQAEFQE